MSWRFRSRLLRATVLAMVPPAVIALSDPDTPVSTGAVMVRLPPGILVAGRGIVAALLLIDLERSLGIRGDAFGRGHVDRAEAERQTLAGHDRDRLGAAGITENDVLRVDVERAAAEQARR